MNLPRLMIFDFDGVILESNEVKDIAFDQVFSRFPEHRDAMMRYHLSSNIIPRREKFRHAVNEILGIRPGEALIEELTASFTQKTREALLRCPFVPGARELLEAFSSKIPLYLASATPLGELEWILKKLGIDRHFKEVGGAPEKKPSMLLRFLGRETAAPEEAIFVGDSPEDELSAQAVGVPFVGRRSRSRFEHATFPVYDDLNGLRGQLS